MCLDAFDDDVKGALDEVRDTVRLIHVIVIDVSSQAQAVRLLSDANDNDSPFRGHVSGAISAFDANHDGLLDLPDLIRVCGAAAHCHSV